MDHSSAKNTGAKQPLQVLVDKFFTVTKKEKRVYQWMEWVVMRNMPISEVDNELTRKLAGIDHINSKTLSKYVNKVANNIVPVIGDTIKAAGVFTILMDG